MAHYLQQDYIWQNLDEDPAAIPGRRFNLTSDPLGWPTFPTLEIREQHIIDYLNGVYTQLYSDPKVEIRLHIPPPGQRPRENLRHLVRPHHRSPQGSPEHRSPQAPGINTHPLQGGSPDHHESHPASPPFSPSNFLSSPSPMRPPFSPSNFLSSPSAIRPPGIPLGAEQIEALVNTLPVEELVDMINVALHRTLPPNVVLSTILNRLPEHAYREIIDRISTQNIVNVEELVSMIEQRFPLGPDLNQNRKLHERLQNIPPRAILLALFRRFDLPPRENPQPGDHLPDRGSHPLAHLTDDDLNSIARDLPIRELLSMVDLNLREALPNDAILSTMYNRLPDRDVQMIVDTFGDHNVNLPRLLDLIEIRLPFRHDLEERRVLPPAFRDFPSTLVLLLLIMRFPAHEQRGIFASLLRTFRVSAQAVVDEILRRFENFRIRPRSPERENRPPDVTSPGVSTTRLTGQRRQLLLLEAAALEPLASQRRRLSVSSAGSNDTFGLDDDEQSSSYTFSGSSSYSPGWVAGGQWEQPLTVQELQQIKINSEIRLRELLDTQSNSPSEVDGSLYSPGALARELSENRQQQQLSEDRRIAQEETQQRRDAGRNPSPVLSGSPYSPGGLARELSAERRQQQLIDGRSPSPVLSGSPYSPAGLAAQLSEERRKELQEKEIWNLQDLQLDGGHLDLNSPNDDEQGWIRPLDLDRDVFPQQQMGGQQGNLIVTHAPEEELRKEDQYGVGNNNLPDTQGQPLPGQELQVQQQGQQRAQQEKGDYNLEFDEEERQQMEDQFRNAAARQQQRGDLNQIQSLNRSLTSYHRTSPKSFPLYGWPSSQRHDLSVVMVGQVNDNAVALRGDIIITHPSSHARGHPAFRDGRPFSSQGCLTVWDGLNTNIVHTHLQHGDLMLRVGMYVERRGEPGSTHELCPYRPYYRLDLYSVNVGTQPLKYKFLGYQHPLKVDETAASHTLECPGKNLHVGEACPPTFRPGLGDIIIRDEAWMENFDHKQNLRRSMVKWYKTRPYESATLGRVEQRTNIPIGSLLVRPFVDRVVPEPGRPMDYARWGFVELYRSDVDGWTFWGGAQLIVDRAKGHELPAGRSLQSPYLPLLYTSDPGPKQDCPHYPNYPYLIYNYK